MSGASNSVGQTDSRTSTQNSNLLATAATGWQQSQHHIGSDLGKLFNESSYGKFPLAPLYQSNTGILGDAQTTVQIKPKCPECGKVYSNNSNLKQHIVNLHSTPNEIFRCPVCHKGFKTRQYMQIHSLSIHGIRQRKSE